MTLRESRYQRKKGESDPKALPAFLVEPQFEVETLFDQHQSVPQRLPARCQRYEEETGVNSDEDAGEIHVLNSDIDQIGRRQIGAVGPDFVGPQSEHTANERDAMEDGRRQDHHGARQ